MTLSAINAGRIWRTVRHLSAEQWWFRLVCRGRRLVMRYTPERSYVRVVETARTLPLPDPRDPRLAAVAEPVRALQMAVHRETWPEAVKGRFTLLNQSFDFGDPPKVHWRGEFNEGNNPLRRMNLAYFGYAVPMLATGDKRQMAAVIRLLRALESQNGWDEPGVFRDVWNPYTASHRLTNLLTGLALYHAGGSAPDVEAEAKLTQHVRFCAAFVLHNLERDLQFNHLLKDYVALAVYAASLPELPKRFAFLERAVIRSIAQNVLPDGGHAERSPMYHLLSMLDLRTLRATGLFANTWTPILDETLRRMTAALGVMSHPDGEIALFNDSWLGEGPPPRGLIDIAATPDTARLPDTGYVRLGQGGDAVIVDCGKCGPDNNPAHAHADFLSLELSVAGRRFIVDTGVPTYTAGAARDASRSASAHNGPAVDGAEPIEFWKSFRVGRRGNAAEIRDPALDGIAPLWTAGWQSGYGHIGIAVRRYVGLWPGQGMLICDLWSGKREGAERAAFLIPDIWTLKEGRTIRFTADGTTVTADALIGKLSTAPEAGAHWLRFGVEQAAHRLAIVPEEAGDARRAALFLAWGDGAAPPAKPALDRIFAALASAPETRP